jgi:hypothetical protein
VIAFIPLHPHSLTRQPFTEGFPCAEIYELLSPDLLHQLIKGVFKDHLVLWVVSYLEDKYTVREAKRIKDIIDCQFVFPHHLNLSHCTVLIPFDSISLAPLFPGLCCFKDGRNFSQWTGNDSKALMKVRVTVPPLLLSPSMLSSVP